VSANAVLKKSFASLLTEWLSFYLTRFLVLIAFAGEYELENPFVGEILIGLTDSLIGVGETHSFSGEGCCVNILAETVGIPLP